MLPSQVGQPANSRAIVVPLATGMGGLNVTRRPPSFDSTPVDAHCVRSMDHTVVPSTVSRTVPDVGAGRRSRFDRQLGHAHVVGHEVAGRRSS